MPNVFQPSLSNTPTAVQQSSIAAINPYATDLLQRGQAFTTAETPVYTGQLTAGPSQYQTQAWQGLANLTVPTNITDAGNQLGSISNEQRNLSYTPGTITNTYNPAAGNYKPINVTNQYTAAGQNYTPANITNTYVPAANKYETIDVTTGTFGNEEAQKYMNPYIQQALDPQLEYMRRQAAINQQGDMAKLAQAGAFGGSRQAILQSQNQEALMRQQAATTGAGYQQAFSQAQQQFNADQARQLEATKANIQQAQTAAQMGMTDAQMMAQYGMTAQQANESSRQFSQNLKMTDAQMIAQYGMQATQANIQQAQKAADLGMTDAELTARYGMDAQKANELSRQFSATYKANELESAARSQQARAAAGGMEAQYGLANLQALSAAGATQHEQEQAALDAQYKDWQRQTDYPGKQLEQQKGIISAMAPLLPERRETYGQKEATAKTGAGFVGGIAALMGIKTFDDLVKKAGEYGMTVDNFKKIFGISVPDTSNPASTGQTGLPSGYKPDEEGRSPPPPGYHRDPDGSLQPDVSSVTIPDYTPDFGGYDPEEFSIAAEGGLVGMLHKMRSYK
jgi:hypothetical protein